MLSLIFQVGQDRVAVDVRRVREVVPRVRLSAVGGGPDWIAGVFVYRGRVVPVVDLHALTGAGPCPPHLSSRIILFPWPADAPRSLVGLLATQVAEIRALRPEAVQPIPGEPGRPGLGAALPDGHGILRVLDPDSLLAQVAARSGGLIELVPSCSARQDELAPSCRARQDGLGASYPARQIEAGEPQ